ncbi:hypothetical protein MN608_04433 [Microdochium nivale]|nr:hypothetical protein MN608_04433 [Microdochium nivale]
MAIVPKMSFHDVTPTLQPRCHRLLAEFLRDCLLAACGWSLAAFGETILIIDGRRTDATSGCRQQGPTPDSSYQPPSFPCFTFRQNSAITSIAQLAAQIPDSSSWL